jgi:hypothetical protein
LAGNLVPKWYAITETQATYREHQVLVVVDGDANGGERVLVGRVEREEPVRVDLAEVEAISC